VKYYEIVGIFLNYGERRGEVGTWLFLQLVDISRPGIPLPHTSSVCYAKEYTIESLFRKGDAYHDSVIFKA
jgi:hypothetical protein